VITFVRYSFGYYRGYYIGLHAMLDVGSGGKIHNSKVSKAKGTFLNG